MQDEKVHFKYISKLANLRQFLETISEVIYDLIESPNDETLGNLDGIMHMSVGRENLNLNYIGWFFAEPYVRYPVTKAVLKDIRKDLDYIELELQKSKVDSPKTHNDLLNLIFTKLDNVIVDISKAHWLLQLSNPIKLELEQFKTSLEKTFDFDPLDKVSAIKNLPKPLVWNGGVATLGTLFYELYYKQKTKNGDYFIEGSPTEITNLVHEMFVQPNGEKFELTSLRTYISASSSKNKPKSNTVQLNTLEDKQED